MKALLRLPFLMVFLGLTAVDTIRSIVAHARGEPYVIEAVRDSMRKDVLVWRVGGRDASKTACREIAASLARGEELTRFGEPDRSVVGGAG